MDAVNAALLDAVRTLFLAEAGAVARERLRQARLGDDLVDKFAYHRMLGGTDKVKILTFDLVHHGIHVVLTHNALNDVAVDHKGRYAIGKSLIYHEITGICKHRGMQTRDIAHEIVKAVAGNTPRSIHIYTVELFHYIGVIGYLKIGNNRLAEALHLNVMGVVGTDRHAGVDDVRDHEHDFSYLCLKLRLLLFKLGKTRGALCDLFLHLLSLGALTVSHKNAYLL